MKNSTNIIEHKSRAWLVLQCLNDFGPQERHFLVGSPDDKEAADSITSLLRGGYIRRIEKELIELTPFGKRKLRSINAGLDSDGGVAGKVTISAGTMPVGYDAPELRRTCLRPGAYDAFELPSLISGERHFRREIRA